MNIDRAGDRFLTSSQAVALVGVTANTLRRWADLGLVDYTRTPANQRLYSERSLCNRNSEASHIGYTRTDKPNALQQTEQIAAIVKHVPSGTTFVTDVSDVLDLNREGLTGILSRAMSGEKLHVTVRRRSDIATIGYGMIEYIINRSGGRLTATERRDGPRERLEKNEVERLGSLS